MTKRARGSIPTSNIMASAIFVTLILLITSVFMTVRDHVMEQKIQFKNSEAIELQGKIIYLDEVLTMSAYMAATTGNLEWEVRYLSHVDLLDDAIEGAIALSEAAYSGKRAALTDEANAKLVKMELKAFNLIRKGEAALAKNILFGSEYSLQKKTYLDGISQFKKAQLTILENEHQMNAKLFYLFMILQVFAILIIIIGWTYISRIIRNQELVLKQRNLTLREKGEESSEQSRAATIQLRGQMRALDRFAIVAETDAKGRITYVNDLFCKISQFSREELIGSDHRIVTSGHQSKLFWKDFWDTISQGEVWRGDIQNKAKDGSIYWVDTTIVPFLDDNGVVAKYLAIRAVITDRKLSEEKARVSGEREKKANEAKSQFLANMSHEIRTPLNAIIGFSNLLKDSELNADQKKKLGIVITSGHGLLEIIEDILYFSEIDASERTLEYIDFNLKGVLEDCVTISSATLKNNTQVELYYEYPETLPEVLHGDPTALRRILLNFMSNAIRFTTKGSVGIVVRETESVSGGERTLSISVKDTGEGIPADKIEHIFGSFAQADDSTTREHGGAGLGLAITKSLVELMGSSIEVQSELGKGSEFCFVVKLKEAKSVLVGKSDGEHNSQDDPSNNLPLQTKVLVVEDNVINQEIIKALLSDLVSEIEIVANGKLAVEKMENDGHYGMILMDLQMPVMGGVEATKLIRKTNTAIPIIAITAASLEKDRQASMAAGMNGFLTKPIDPELLKRTILKWFQ